MIPKSCTDSPRVQDPAIATVDGPVRVAATRRTMPTPHRHVPDGASRRAASCRRLGAWCITLLWPCAVLAVPSLADWRRQADEARVLIENDAPAACVQALQLQAVSFHPSDRKDEARRHHEQMRAQAVAARTRVLEGHALLGLGGLNSEGGGFATAQRAYALARDIGVPRFLSESARRMSAIAARIGDNKQPYRLTTEALEMTAKAAPSSEATSCSWCNATRTRAASASWPS